MNARVRDIPHLIPTAKLAQHLIGFNDIFRTIENAIERAETVGNYPPKNVIEISENEYVIQFAVSGFSKDELKVSIEKQNLVVVEGTKFRDKETGRVLSDLEGTYHVKGISTKDFRHEISVTEGSDIKVRYDNGLLSILISKPIKLEPEPKLIPII